MSSLRRLSRITAAACRRFTRRRVLRRRDPLLNPHPQRTVLNNHQSRSGGEHDGWIVDGVARQSLTREWRHGATRERA
jgi:hypothetical protein